MVPYQQVRDRFLEAAQSTDEIEWLVAVGRFVQDRWLAEEALRPDGAALDEQAVWGVWDQCSEKQLRDLRTEAGASLKEYTKRRAHLAIRAYIKRKLKPLDALIKATRWTAEQSLRAIVGAIALILVGIVLVALYPGVVKRAQSTLEGLLHEPEAAPKPSPP